MNAPALPRYTLFVHERPGDPPWTYISFMWRNDPSFATIIRRLEQAHCLDAARDLMPFVSWISLRGHGYGSMQPGHWTWELRRE